MGDVQINDWRPFIFGGLASILAELGTFPLDTTKTRLQIQGQKLDKKHSKLKYSGMTHALYRISREEGFRALYCGISSAILRQSTYGTIKIGTYYSLQDIVIRNWGTDDIVIMNIICAVLAGAISSAIANPTDLIKIRMQIQGIEGKLSLIGSFKSIYKHEGLRGLWRGVGPTVQRAALIAAAELPIYDFSKSKCMSLLGDSVSNHFVFLLIALHMGTSCTWILR